MIVGRINKKKKKEVVIRDMFRVIVEKYNFDFLYVSRYFICR